MHQRGNHSDAASADLVDGGVLQLSASTWPHLLQQEQSPLVPPLSSHQFEVIRICVIQAFNKKKKSKLPNYIYKP
jgi:hypothetical protein